MKCSLATAVLLSCAGAASAADLLDVYRQARSSDPTYASAKSGWAAAQERIPQARAGLLPLASVTASTQYNDRVIRFRDETLPQQSANFGNNNVSLTVTQPLYRRQNWIAVDQALTQVQQADAQLALAAQDLILRAAQAYFDVLLAHDNVALAEAQKTAIGQQLEQAKRNFEVGTATITDTHEAQARYDLTAAQEIAARNELELRKRALEQVIGRQAPPLAPLGSRFAMKSPEPATMDTWVDMALKTNLQVQVARSATTFAQQEIERNRAAHLPTLDAFVTVGGSGTGAGTAGGVGNDTRSGVVGVQLALPIYQGGLVSSRVREAIANQSRASDDLEAARRTAEFNARQGFLGITSGIAQVRALEAALVSTVSQLDSTRVGQEVGVRTQIDVLNAQQLLFSAQRDLAQSKYTYVLSLLRLEAAIGELTESDLVAVNQWLDPTAAAGTPPVVPTPPREALATAKPVAPRPELATAKPVAPRPATPAIAPAKDAAADVSRAVRDWAKAWASNDVEQYLAFYAPDFETPKGVARERWESERRARIQKPRTIEVDVGTPQVKLESAERAVVTFRQHYRSGAIDLDSDKTMVLIKRGERWLVQQERVTSESPRAAAR
jgi:outer membrane protein